MDEPSEACQEYYRRLIDACPDTLLMADLAGKVLFASPHTRQLLRLPESEPLVGRSVFDFVVQADRARLAANIADVLRTGERHATEYTAQRADGTTVPVEVSSSVLREPNGTVTSAMAVIRDVSARRRAIEALQHERQVLSRLLQASDHERQVIAYDIHDGLAQQLAGAIMQFQLYEHLRDHDPEGARKAYEGGLTLLRQAHFEARRLISGVRPPILDEAGVTAAIAHLVNERHLQKGPKIEVHSRISFQRLPPIMENAIYRIVQEALNNASRHSGSPRVRIRLLEKDDCLHIEVRDWGAGFRQPATGENRFGLEGIRQRARLLGGTCRIRSRPGQGTTVRVSLPLTPAALG